MKAIAHIKAYRRAGGAVVTITRDGRKHRHCIGLARYRQFQEVLQSGLHCRRSGVWGRHGLDFTLWAD